MSALKNRKTAWIITILLIIAGIFLGSYTTYLRLRRPVVQAFRTEVVPLLNEQIQMTYNMLTIYRLNAPDDTDTADQVMANIERLQREMAVMGMYSELSALLSWDAEGLYQLSEPLNLNENDAGFMRNSLTDIIELLMVLRQSRYDEYVREFNSAARGGLWILTRHWRLYPEFGNPDAGEWLADL